MPDRSANDIVLGARAELETKDQARRLDHFAAAALTGLLSVSPPDRDCLTPEALVATAWHYAHLMLGESEKWKAEVKS